MAKDCWKYHTATAPQRTEIERVRKEYGKLAVLLKGLECDPEERADALTQLKHSFSCVERAILLYVPEAQV